MTSKIRFCNCSINVTNHKFSIIIPKEYLYSLTEEDKKLPQGAVFLSPTNVFGALSSELISKDPEILKIACLKEISTLFENPPFEIGLGNKLTDVKTYSSINCQHIYIVNKKSEVIKVTNYFSSVSHLHNSFDPIVELKEKIIFLPLFHFLIYNFH